MFIEWSLSTVVQCVEGKFEWKKKQHMVPNKCQNRRPYRTQTLFSFSASPSPIVGTTENPTFAHFKTAFLSDYPVLCVTLILTRSSPRDCEMSFFIGRGFAELQILKTWKWPYLLNWVDYCDEILHTHWYWQDVAHEIVKWHFSWQSIPWKNSSDGKIE